ncbi:MAG TPA: hypothetical protein VNI57_02625, partial [Candidatus Saccharimonadales bacterium]|nr:hypothetical protein [Candidatus Saccharimonadales bacterium]
PGPATAAATGGNLALHRSYRLDPAPNYPRASVEDAGQLTDGVSTRGSFWTSPSTLGWTGCTAISIVVDLGRVEPISGASFSTAAGRGGVRFPRSIAVLVSDDGRLWFLAGDLVPEDGVAAGKVPTGFQRRVLTASGWSVHGRWVRFDVRPRGDLLFVDEIGVAPGDSSSLARPLPGVPFPSIDHFRVWSGVQHRLRGDGEILKRRIEQAPLPARRKNSLERSLRRARSRPSRAGEISDPAGFRARIPLGPEHRELFAVQARLWRATGFRAPRCRVEDSVYDPVPLFAAEPAAPPSSASVDMILLRGEVRPFVVTCRNPLPHDLVLEAHVDGLEGDADLLSFRQVAVTDSEEGDPASLALVAPSREGGATLVIAPGMSAQLWVDVQAGADRAPGTRHGLLRLTDAGGDRLRVPVVVTIAPVSLPSPRRLQFGGWDYTNRDRIYGVTPRNRDALIALLRDHLVNTAWGTKEVLPTGRYDGQGDLTQPPDRRDFDAWIARWGPEARYLVYLDAGDRFAGEPMGSARFEKKVSAWIDFWARHAREMGLSSGQLGVLLVDEPRTREEDERILAWSEVLKRAAPDIEIWGDPSWRDPTRMDPRLFDLSDVLCPNRWLWLKGGSDYLEPFQSFRRKPGKRIGLYAPARVHGGTDPYLEGRLFAWEVFASGGDEEHVWSFAATGGPSSWNPYLLTQPSYSPVFLDATDATSTKLLEALREGVEDFEILAALREAASARRAVSADDTTCARAENLLTSGVAEVLASRKRTRAAGAAGPERGVADRVRARAVRLLLSLSRP